MKKQSLVFSVVLTVLLLGTSLEVQGAAPQSSPAYARFAGWLGKKTGANPSDIKFLWSWGSRKVRRQEVKPAESKRATSILKRLGVTTVVILAAIGTYLGSRWAIGKHQEALKDTENEATRAEMKRVYNLSAEGSAAQYPEAVQEKNTVLMRAIEKGDTGPVQILIDDPAFDIAYVSFMNKGSGKWTPLIAAIEKRKYGIAKMLIDTIKQKPEGKQLLSQEGAGSGSALMIAVEVGDDKIVQALVNAGADVDLKELVSGQQKSPLEMAKEWAEQSLPEEQALRTRYDILQAKKAR